jgi:hypothetical protein
MPFYTRVTGRERRPSFFCGDAVLYIMFSFSAVEEWEGRRLRIRKS